MKISPALEKVLTVVIEFELVNRLDIQPGTKGIGKVYFEKQTPEAQEFLREYTALSKTVMNKVLAALGKVIPP